MSTANVVRRLFERPQPQAEPPNELDDIQTILSVLERHAPGGQARMFQYIASKLDEANESRPDRTYRFEG